jgi:hypothetical protein
MREFCVEGIGRVTELPHLARVGRRPVASALRVLVPLAVLIWLALIVGALICSLGGGR